MKEPAIGLVLFSSGTGKEKVGLEVLSNTQDTTEPQSNIILRSRPDNVSPISDLPKCC